MVSMAIRDWTFINILSKAFVFTSALFLVACVSDSRMPDVADDKAQFAPKATEAMVVFIRPTRVNQYHIPSLHDVTDGTPKFIGLLPAWKKFAYAVSPGKRRFMSLATGTAAQFADAELQAGRTYYVRVTPSIWSTKFFLEPYHKSQLVSGEVSDDLKGAKWVMNTPASRQWAAGKKQGIMQKLTKSLKAWLRKSDRPALRPEDGR